jgi:hypothetical protein
MVTSLAAVDRQVSPFSDIKADSASMSENGDIRH